MRNYKLGLLAAALCSAVLVAERAEAGFCYGEQVAVDPGRDFRVSSECTDSETGGEAFAFIAQWTGEVADGLLVTAEGVRPEDFQDWTVIGWTFDVNGSVIDGCTGVLEYPEVFWREFGLDACHDAATLLSFGQFTQ
jgi:hypothetical protein